MARRNLDEQIAAERKRLHDLMERKRERQYKSVRRVMDRAVSLMAEYDAMGLTVPGDRISEAIGETITQLRDDGYGEVASRLMVDYTDMLAKIPDRARLRDGGA